MIPERYTQKDAEYARNYGDISYGIPFDWWLVSAQGAGFCLLPTKGVDSMEQVKKAKYALQRDRDVVGKIKVFWLNP